MNVILGRFLFLSVGRTNDGFIRIGECWMSDSPQAGNLRWQARECIFLLTFSLVCLLPLLCNIYNRELNPSALSHYCYFGNLMHPRQRGTGFDWMAVALFNMYLHHSNIFCSMSIRRFVSVSCCSITSTDSRSFRKKILAWWHTLLFNAQERRRK